MYFQREQPARAALPPVFPRLSDDRWICRLFMAATPENGLLRD